MGHSINDQHENRRPPLDFPNTRHICVVGVRVQNHIIICGQYCMASEIYHDKHAIFNQFLLYLDYFDCLFLLLKMYLWKSNYIFWFSHFSELYFCILKVSFNWFWGQRLVGVYRNSIFGSFGTINFFWNFVNMICYHPSSYWTSLNWGRPWVQELCTMFWPVVFINYYITCS